MQYQASLRFQWENVLHPAKLGPENPESDMALNQHRYPLFVGRDLNAKIRTLIAIEKFHLIHFRFEHICIVDSVAHFDLFPSQNVNPADDIDFSIRYRACDAR